MRYVLTPGLALIAAFFLFTSSGDAGGGCEDPDGDGVAACLGTGPDNCVFVPNGPLLGSCSAQEDGDLDGYGNSCDSDINNDGATGLDDVSSMFTAAAIFSPGLATDLNCNGAADLTDVSKALADAAAIAMPGPSEHTCAGTIPCP
jgi:hypothetical protein